MLDKRKALPTIHRMTEKGRDRTIAHERTHHYVGQGFFHTASVNIHGQDIRYVYDCGSEDLELLREVVERYLSDDTDSGPIDLLAISHFHDDHISGIDLLLSRAAPKIVLLPYLTPIEQLYAVAHESASGRGSVEVVTLISDPSTWFGRRGVPTIIQVEGGEPPESPPPNIPDPPDNPPQEFVESMMIDFNGIRLHANGSGKTPSGATVNTFKMNQSDPIGIAENGRKTNDWFWIPFVHPETQRMEPFRQAILALLPDAPFSSWESDGLNWMLSVLQNTAKRQRLTGCYYALRKDLNLTSMCLFSGPTTKRSKHLTSIGASRVNLESRSVGDEREVNAFLSKFLPNFPLGLGWLGTGDANLLRKRRLKCFLEFYKELTPHISTVSVPHHGSRYNAGLELFRRFSNREFIVSSGQKNRYKHPHRQVIEELDQVHGNVVLTENFKSSGYRESFEFTFAT